MWSFDDQKKKWRTALDLINLARIGLSSITGRSGQNNQSKKVSLDGLPSKSEGAMGKLLHSRQPHDYGDTSTWPSQEAKKANMKNRMRSKSNWGLKLLPQWRMWSFQKADATHRPDRCKIGVRFDPAWRSWLKAVENLCDQSFKKYLMSSWSSHLMRWSKKFSKNSFILPPWVGHTHGMQLELRSRMEQNGSSFPSLPGSWAGN